ncbi:hypothetical protein GOHSU_12_01010 [Gordonia hirsuta DSM 44140 = NBRC 16056]|uniref:Uncharacterized protein n=1 Tax=Gordonia hirsuta DSM 44140 = NBRC 16056 TaxID=1121927 RepID=L7L7H4_9ACTN|nr:hypothetical protein [Gordonia hirsuta]GAC56711.1 hypothetical protein GOHSU_12_01010 [Gordonia hirsuta DSM 44140 = NBRC 16056]
MSPLIPMWWDVVFATVPLLILLLLGFSIYAAIRSYRVAKQRGIDPLTADTELKTRLIQSDLLAASGTSAAKSVEQRLAEVDDLHVRQLISSAERESARSRILGEL